MLSTRFLLDLVNLIGLGCWCVCFWWMHRISSRQNAVLDQLRRQAERIEQVSREEHALVAELHPNVKSLHKEVVEVSEKVDHVQGQSNSSAAAVP
jgi:hypothetical protein